MQMKCCRCSLTLCLDFLLSGIFPQGDYPEEVSTDEDDEMFGSRKRMKRARRREDIEDGAPTGKKNKAHTGWQRVLSMKSLLLIK